MNPEGGGVGQAFDVAGLERRHQQAEAGDGDGVGVEIDAVNTVQGLLHGVAQVASRLVPGPHIEQALESAEQEVAGTAGGIDQAHFLVAEFIQRRRQGAIENEFLDELRGLQQGVALAGGFREVLVEIAQEAGVPGRVGEVVGQ